MQDLTRHIGSCPSYWKLISPDLGDFKVIRMIEYQEEFLRCMDENLRKITPQLVDGIHTETNKKRYLCST